MLIDTSGFFSLHDKSENQHAKAVEIYQKSWLRLTTNYVLAEYTALALIRGLSREISEALPTDKHLPKKVLSPCSNNNLRDWLLPTLMNGQVNVA